MEKGANSSSGFSVTDKKPSSNRDVVSLTKIHSSNTETFPSKICTMVVHHPENYLGLSFGGGDDGGGGGGGGVGPVNCKSGGANEVVVGNIYRDDVSFSGESFSRHSTNLQPFDIFPSPYAYTNKSPGGEMGFPFTSAQWKELERQALIYKYMISSVPVPPDLLFPLSTSFRTSAVDSSSSLYNVRYSKNGDPEPGRCKRTDGKKWRCSRDVAPHQKYCERHLHRGRPRSRKPVEVKNNNPENHKKSRLEQTPLPKSTVSKQQLVTGNEPLLLFNANTDLSISNSTAPSYNKGTNRDLGLVMEGGMVGAEHQWQNLMESSHMGLGNEGSSIYGSSAPVFDYMEQQPFNLYSYSNFLDPVTEAPPIGFIDAWSIDNNNLNSCNNGSNSKSSVSPNHGNLSPSLNLSMAMAAGNVLDEEMSRIEVANGNKSCDDHGNGKDLRWLSPVSWEQFSRAGPLAEAFAIGSSNPASPYDSIGSTPATTVSSPSGVLHRTPFSHSDSSVCNSPILGAQVSTIRNCIQLSQLE